MYLRSYNIIVIKCRNTYYILNNNYTNFISRDNLLKNVVFKDFFNADCKL